VDIEIRSLRDDDVAAAQLTAYHSLRNAGIAYGWETPELDDAVRERGQRRMRHALRHDPGGAFVADRDGEIVGVSLATRRGPLWFLSLLAVATDVQSQGVGRRLLEAACATFDGVGMLCASSDPKALRRYRRAGFDLVPAYVAEGAVDRALLPPPGAVRAASYDDDREFVEEIAVLQRQPATPCSSRTRRVGAASWSPLRTAPRCLARRPPRPRARCCGPRSPRQPSRSTFCGSRASSNGRSTSRSTRGCR
jgi:predicted N-acetyltransferase YhbS